MLTSAEVSGKTFTPTRLREGYEMAEVDQFVADVRETLAHREKEVGDLRGQLTSATAGTERHASAQPGNGDQVRDSSVAAARLLEVATVSADQLVSDAKKEAESLVAAASAEAERLTAAARGEADRVTAELAQRKAQTVAELDRHRESVLAEVGERKATLESQVGSLQQLETENRDRLRTYFTGMLDRLEDSAEPIRSAALD